MNVTTEYQDVKEKSSPAEILSGQATSKDGTTIAYRQTGRGPGLLIVHGGFRASQHYLRLARALADAFTVTIMDRRGRNASGPKGDHYSLQTECDDVIALLQQTGATRLFGHSYGGLVGLNVALQYPLERLALYEPAVIIDNSIAGDWLPRMEQELERKDYISASLSLVNGLKMGGTLGKLPRPLLKLVFGAFARGPEWEENIPLLLTFPSEAREGLRVQGVQRYAGLRSKTLVMAGTKSPDYLIHAARELGATLPDVQNVSMQGLEHNAPDENAPEIVAAALRKFLM